MHASPRLRRSIYLWLLLVALALLTACNGAETSPAAPTATPTLPPSSLLCVWQTSPRQLAQVLEVIDGDTIRVEVAGEEYKVRYIGVDTPEREQPFYAEASQVNAELVEGQTVLLVQDISETDQYGRLLRYVFVGDTFVNYELVSRGYAAAATFPPDVACEAMFRQAEADARQAQRGLWAP